jgi:hypothetical protein
MIDVAVVAELDRREYGHVHLHRHRFGMRTLPHRLGGIWILNRVLVRAIQPSVAVRRDRRSRRQRYTIAAAAHDPTRSIARSTRRSETGRAVPRVWA